MVVIIDCGSTKVPQIVDFVSEFTECVCVKISNFQAQEFPILNGFIISGAPILITEMDLNEHSKKIAEILNSGVPVLGICFGHQMIGLHFGAKAFKMAEDREINTIDVLFHNKLFLGLEKKFEMTEDHCEHISLPEDFVHIASSNKCWNEGMKHTSKEIYGIQFHPESSGILGKKIIENFIAICTKASQKIA